MALLSLEPRLFLQRLEALKATSLQFLGQSRVLHDFLLTGCLRG